MKLRASIHARLENIEHRAVALKARAGRGDVIENDELYADMTSIEDAARNVLADLIEEEWNED